MIIDRRQRFDVAGRLWAACAGCITPDQVCEMATRIYNDLLDGEIVRREVRDAGVPEARAPHVASLVLLVLHDRADAELAALKASVTVADHRRDCE